MNTPYLLPRLARTFAGSALLFLTATSATLAAPLWKIDLSAMEVDEKIAVSSYISAQVNENPQSVGAGSVTIANNYTVGSAVLSGHSVVISKPTRTTSSETRFTMIGSSGDYSTTTNYELRFDVLLSKSAFDSATSLNVRMINNNSSTSVGALVFHVDGKLSLNSAFSTSGFSTADNVWSWGEVLHFKLQVDADNKRFNVLLNDALVGHLDLDNTGATYPNLGVSRIWFGSNSDNSLFADGLGITNIETFTTLSPIPEPSKTALLLLGGGVVALFVRARRRHSAIS